MWFENKLHTTKQLYEAKESFTKKFKYSVKATEELMPFTSFYNTEINYAVTWHFLYNYIKKQLKYIFCASIYK